MTQENSIAHINLLPQNEVLCADDRKRQTPISVFVRLTRETLVSRNKAKENAERILPIKKECQLFLE
jgi:hypothetical protein